jgi:hypothetical protein
LYTDFILQNPKLGPSDVLSFYHMLLVDALYGSSLRMNLVIKGLNAAKLGYGLTKGEQKLKFVMIEEIPRYEIIKIIDILSNKFLNIEIKDTLSRRYTDLIILNIKDKNLDDEKLEIEFTKLDYKWKRDIHYHTKILSVDFWNLSVISQIVVFSQIINDHPNEEVLKRLDL